MRTHRRTACLRPSLLLAAAAALALPAGAAAEGIVTVGTDNHTGAYYHGGGGLCALINEGRSEHRMRCRVSSTDGAVDNINALRRGERALGFAPAHLALDAFHGRATFAEQGEFSGLRVVTALGHETVALVAANAADIAEVRDLAGQRVNIGAAGSTQRAMMNGLMNRMGWSAADFADSRALTAAEQVEAFCSGELDAVLFVASHPDRAVRDTLDCGGRLVPVDGPAIDSMVRGHDAFHTAAIAAGSYPGVNEDVPSYSVVALLLSSTNTERSTIFEVTRALYDNIERFRDWHRAFADLETAAMVERTRGLDTPLHPGARMYLERADLL